MSQPFMVSTLNPITAAVRENFFNFNLIAIFDFKSYLNETRKIIVLIFVYNLKNYMFIQIFHMKNKKEQTINLS